MAAVPDRVKATLSSNRIWRTSHKRQLPAPRRSRHQVHLPRDPGFPYEPSRDRGDRKVGADAGQIPVSGHDLSRGRGNEVVDRSALTAPNAPNVPGTRNVATVPPPGSKRMAGRKVSAATGSNDRRERMPWGASDGDNRDGDHRRFH